MVRNALLFSLLLTGGCSWYFSDDERTSLRDRDGDGAVAQEVGGTDCNDADPTVGPHASETCGDGLDNNCDGVVDDAGVGETTWWKDVDGDGYGDATTSRLACNLAEDGWVQNSDDCDDGQDDAFPGNPEVCDDLDNDCDGDVDEGLGDVVTYYEDADGDGFGTESSATNACSQPSGYVTAQTEGFDCDDTDELISPTANEVWYDGIDQDCDGASDYDQDGDGFDNEDYGGTDCDDLDPGIRPGVADPWYDGVDQDCAGNDDYDKDGDGFSSDEYGGQDCDDDKASVNPDQSETWYNGVDEDCDGQDDYDQDGDGVVSSNWGGEDCDDLDPSIYTLWTLYEDLDGDGWGGGGLQSVCGDDEAPAGWLTDGGDCDDDPSDDGTAFNEIAENINPAADEIWYDGVDQDCSGGSDYDQDGDGFDAEEHGGADCLDVGELVTHDGQDTFAAASINPDEDDTWYDGVDQDCDGLNDFDQDEDGFVSDAYPDTEGGTAPGAGDCADVPAGASTISGGSVLGDQIHPNATETWYDGVDQDCDGMNDFDQDGDLYVAQGYDAHVGSLDTGDCNDLESTISPGATENWYDGTDQDCSGGSDYDQDGDGEDSAQHGGADCADAGTINAVVGDATLPASQINPDADETWYDGIDQDCSHDGNGLMDFDQDGDGYDCDPNSTYNEVGSTPQCPLSSGTDCSDFASVGGFDPGAVSPAVQALDDNPYDGIDENCDDQHDYDRDGDGWVPDAYSGSATWQSPFGTIHQAQVGDCDDDYTDDPGGSAPGASDVNPDATETWYDGIDQDCAQDDDFDQDGDGFACDSQSLLNDCAGSNGSDCDDDPSDDIGNPGDPTDPNVAANVNDDATEIWYDGIDQDCSDDGKGAFDFDQDGDGVDCDPNSSYNDAYPCPLSNGSDCADSQAVGNLDASSIKPTKSDLPYDGIDQDCDNQHDYDNDGDGYVAEAYDSEATWTAPNDDVIALQTGDCDDTIDGQEKWSHPGTFVAGADIHPGLPEQWYDDIDQNCDGLSDFDQDGDLHDCYGAWDDACDFGNGLSWDSGGSNRDCIDYDPLTNMGADEIWYSGFNENCDERHDFDQDGDGYIEERWQDYVGWTAQHGEPTVPLASTTEWDCLDEGPLAGSAYPGNTSIVPDDGIDNDCDGIPDQSDLQPGQIYAWEDVATRRIEIDDATDVGIVNYGYAYYQLLNTTLTCDDCLDIVVARGTNRAFVYDGPFGPGEADVRTIDNELARLPSGNTIATGDHWQNGDDYGDIILLRTNDTTVDLSRGPVSKKVGEDLTLTGSDRDGRVNLDTAIDELVIDERTGAIVAGSGSDVYGWLDISTSNGNQLNADAIYTGTTYSGLTLATGQGISGGGRTVAVRKGFGRVSVIDPVDDSVTPRTVDAPLLDGDGHPFVVGDIWGDGGPDLAVAVPTDNGNEVIIHNRVVVNSSNWDYITLAHASSGGSGGFGVQVAGGDFNADAVQDVAIVDAGTDEIYLFTGPFTKTSYDTGSSEVITIQAPSGSLTGARVASGDLAGQVSDELVISSPNLGAVYILSNDRF